MSSINNISTFISVMHNKSKEIKNLEQKDLVSRFAMECYVEYEKIMEHKNSTDLTKHQKHFILEPIPEKIFGHKTSAVYTCEEETQNKDSGTKPNIYSLLDGKIHKAPESFDKNTTVDSSKSDHFKVETLLPSKFGTHLLESKVIDDELSKLIDKKETPCVAFITDENDPDVIKKYFKRNFPITEYYCTFKPDMNYNTKTYIKIIYNGLEKPEKIESRISNSLLKYDYFDVWSTLNESVFMSHISSFHSKTSKKFFCKPHPIDGRLTSYRFYKWVKKDFVLPSKTDVISKFEKYIGDKIPTAYYSDIPLCEFVNLKGKLHGYSVVRTKIQPENTNFTNIIVFREDKK